MKVFVRLLPLLVLAVLLSACGGQNLSKEEMDHYVPLTQDLIIAFKDKDVDTLVNASNDKMTAYFQDPKNLEESHAVLDEDGAIKKFAKVTGFYEKDEETDETSINILQNVRFENRSRTFGLSYNQDGELIGIYAK